MKLNTQKYLDEKGLKSLVEEFNIKVNEYDDVIVLNYCQISSPKFNSICDECRSLILEKNTWRVLSYPFQRFYNYGESIDFNTCKVIDPIRIASFEKDHIFISRHIQDAIIEHKIDGCCSEKTIILSQKGPITIKELCEKEERIKILAYDTNLEKTVWTDIIAFSIKSNNNDWFEIEMENGKTIKLTSEHYIWLDDLKCYRKVKELKEGDSILFFE